MIQQAEAVAFLQVFAIIETEHLLIKATEQMKQLYRNIRARDAALQQTSEVPHRVCVDAPINAFRRMVYNFVRVVGCQSFIRKQSIRIGSRARFNVLTNSLLQR